MSSFIHSSKHFTSVENKIIETFKKDRYFLPYSFWGIRNSNEVCSYITKQFNELREISVLAVTLQYADHYGNNLNNEIQVQLEEVNRKTTAEPLTMVQLYRALQSIDYQIELEHIERIRELTEAEKEAMQFLENIRNYCANYIIIKSNEYNDENKGWAI